MGWALLIFGGLTFLIVKQKDYFLISGFANRPKEEQEYLKQNGFIDALGKLLICAFILFAVSFILGLFSVPFGFEIGLAVFTIVLLTGTIWIQRYEVPHKRKKNYWILGSVWAVTFLFLIGLSVYSLSENEIAVEEDHLIISGMYGNEVSFSDIEQVVKMNQFPEVIVRINGFAMNNRLKGKFQIAGYSETVTLFISGDSTAYLVVKTKEDTIIFNRDTETELDRLYQQLQTY
ncbi:DUF3784 domain-containing protein [Gracilibacillus sp. HCP3S3_G5_1]|uniref:DUF3784 domain-containing protein n=1 Tax=unclassified Gracilibacillus TaxID=2625209 RepID=UPI003F8C47AA